VKDLRSGEQEAIQRSEVSEYIRRRLNLDPDLPASPK
jgi:hypothetical protein